MRKMLSFTFGVLIGTVVATAWAQYHNYPTVDSPRNQAGAMAPHEMTVNTQMLPVQHYEAI
jgi:Rieske Fe-S protein